MRVNLNLHGVLVMSLGLGQDWLVLQVIDGDDMIAFQSACAEIWICLWNYDACQSLPCLTKWQRTTNWQCTSWGLPKSLFCIRASARCLNVCITSVSGNVESLRRSPISNTSNLYLLMVHICNSQLRSHVVSSNRLWRPMAAPCNSETGWCWSYFCKRCIQCVHVKLTFFLTWRTCVCDDLQWRT